MNAATPEQVQTAKLIAANLRACKFKFYSSARANNGRVFVQTSDATWQLGDLLPAGWGARQVAGKYDALVVMWVG